MTSEECQTFNSQLFIFLIISNWAYAIDFGWSVSLKSIPPSYFNLSTPNVLRCGKLCEGQGRCIAATFDKQQRTCYMHESVVERDQAVESGRYLYKEFQSNTRGGDTECDNTQISIPAAPGGDRQCYSAKGLEQTPGCPPSYMAQNYTYNPLFHICYKFITDEVNWEDAKTICNSDDGHMFLVENETINTWLVNKFRTEYSTYEKLLIDGNDKEQDNVFKNYRDDPMSYMPWGAGEPNNYGGNEDCVAISKFHSFSWVDIPCTGFGEQGKFCICQVDL